MKLSAIHSLNNGKSAGIDGIPNEFFKCTSFKLSESITRIINLVFTSHVFPQAWNTSVICPVFKAGDPQNPSNYRPISLTPSMNKIWSSVMCNRLSMWAEDVLSPAQAGFRKGYSTLDNIFTLSNIVSYVINKQRGKLYTAFIDLKAAFDSVDRRLLFDKLSGLGVNGNFLNTLKSMYSCVKAQVRVGDRLTRDFVCNTGVKQGRALSPLLFSLYINDIEMSLRAIGFRGVKVGATVFYCLMYADDLVIFSENHYMLQEMLNALVEYCKMWHLNINESKSKVVIFRKGGRISRFDRFHINGKLLEIVNSFKYLGVEFSWNGQWTHARKTLIDHANNALSALKRSPIFRNLPPHLKLYIFDNKILPILLYSSEVWSSKCFDENDIDGVLYKFCKYVLGLPHHCVNVTALGELGRSRISIYGHFRKVKYWLQMLRHSNDRYTICSYKPLVEMAVNNIACWAKDVKDILSITGFGDVWTQGGNLANDQLFLCNFSQRLVDIDMQIWSANVFSMNKLYLYRNFKTSNSYEFYLAHINSWFHRSILSKFRCGCFDLNVNKGRSLNIPRHARICSLCNMNKIEDEFHFLIECPFYYELRLLYLPRFFFAVPTLQKFYTLLNTTNTNLLYRLSKYLISARNYRAEIVYHIDTL